MNILVQSSEYYAPMLGVMLTSLFENNKEEANIQVFLITSDMSQRNREKFLKLAAEYQRKIEFIDAKMIDQMLAEAGALPYHGSYAVYYKSFVISLLPESIDRILFMDADMIILGPLSEAYRCKLDENEILAMSQAIITNSYMVKRLKLEEDCYYSAGLILFDVRKWKKANGSQKILELLKSSRSGYPLGEEIPINFVFHPYIKKLPMRYGLFSAAFIWKDWNLHKTIYRLKKCYSEEEFNQALTNPTLIHYGCPPLDARPWNYNKAIPDIFWSGCEEWEKYWKKSLWNDCPKKENRLTFIQKCVLISYKILPINLFSTLYGHLQGIVCVMILKRHGL